MRLMVGIAKSEAIARLKRLRQAWTLIGSSVRAKMNQAGKSGEEIYKELCRDDCAEGAARDAIVSWLKRVDVKLGDEDINSVVGHLADGSQRIRLENFLDLTRVCY